MIRHCFGLLMGCAALLLAGCAGNPPADGGSTAPQSEFLRTSSEMAVVDFFDMYCHTCQTAAAHVNRLHDLVQRRGLSSKIAFYAVGVNNTEMEANLYRTRFHVPYPVIADRERVISSRYGEFRPPLLLALKRVGGQWKEIYRTNDPMVPPEKILDEILR